MSAEGDKNRAHQMYMGSAQRSHERSQLQLELGARNGDPSNGQREPGIVPSIRNAYGPYIRRSMESPGNLLGPPLPEWEDF